MTIRPVLCSAALVLMMLAWGYALYIFHKVSKRLKKDTPERGAFNVSDLLALFAAILPPLALVSAFRDSPNYGSTFSLIISLILVLVFAVMWWQAVQILDRSVVKNVTRRFIYLALLFPGLLAGAVAAAVTFLATPAIVDSASGWPYWLISTLSLALAGWLIALGQKWVFQIVDEPLQDDDQPIGSS